MKRLQARAGALISASPAQCLSLLAAVDRYPEWHPDVVRKVTVLARDARDHAAKVEARLHISRGPLKRELELMLAVTVEEPAIRLTRLPYDPADEEEFELTWNVGEGAQTRIELDLAASLDIPRAVPLGGVAEAMAQGFVSAAARALSAR